MLSPALPGMAYGRNCFLSFSQFLSTAKPLSFHMLPSDPVLARDRVVYITSSTHDFRSASNFSNARYALLSRISFHCFVHGLNSLSLPIVHSPIVWLTS